MQGPPWRQDQDRFTMPELSRNRGRSLDTYDRVRCDASRWNAMISGLGALDTGRSLLARSRDHGRERPPRNRCLPNVERRSTVGKLLSSLLQCRGGLLDTTPKNRVL